MTIARLFWRKWCFVSIQHHMKIYLLLQKKKTATELLTWTFFFFKLQRRCWKQAKWPLDDHCFTILYYFLLHFHPEKLSRALEQCRWGMHNNPEVILRELKVKSAHITSNYKALLALQFKYTASQTLSQVRGMNSLYSVHTVKLKTVYYESQMVTFFSLFSFYRTLNDHMRFIKHPNLQMVRHKTRNKVA